MTGYDPRISGWWRTKNRTYTRRWPMRIPEKETLEDIVVELGKVVDPKYPAIYMSASNNEQVTDLDSLLGMHGRRLHKVDLYANGYQVTLHSGLRAKTEVRVDPYVETVNLAVAERIVNILEAGGVHLSPRALVFKTPVVVKTDRDTIDQRRWEQKVQRGAGLYGALGGAVASVVVGAIAKAAGWI